MRAILALAVVAVLAGCGGGGGGTSSSGAGTTAAAAPAPAAGGAKLVGTVGPGYTITLTQGGSAVSALPAGTYTFTVTDEASIHGFTLEQEEGGSFEQALTSVPEQGTKTTTVKLTKGEWKFYCPSHESQMNGSFTVT